MKLLSKHHTAKADKRMQTRVGNPLAAFPVKNEINASIATAIPKIVKIQPITVTI